MIVASVKGRVHSLQLLPGKRTILFTVFRRGTGMRRLRSLCDRSTRPATDADSRWGRRAVRANGPPRYFAAGTLLAVPFDLRALAVSGAPVPVAEDVASVDLPGRAPPMPLSPCRQAERWPTLLAVSTRQFRAHLSGSTASERRSPWASPNVRMCTPGFLQMAAACRHG